MNAPIKIKSYTVLTNLDCNLACTYCYENKCGKVNTKEDTAKYLEALYKSDFEGNKENQEEMQIYVDFIGGETLLYPELLDAACETALACHKKYGVKKDFTVTLTTNGTLLTGERQQAFVKKWARYLNIGISIDGTRENHDACRVDKRGKGSYDRAVEGWNWLRKNICPMKTGAKATYCHKTINGYADGVINLVNLGFTFISANVVFEETWDKEKDAMHLFGQMVKVIDYLFANGLENKVEIFQINNHELDMKTYRPRTGKKERNHCGACTHMRCLGFDKEIYGCQRFATMQHPLPIGRMDEGGEIVITDQSFCEEVAAQYESWPVECLECPFTHECPSCAAIPYEQDGPEAFYARKPQCGFTHALVAARLYFRKRLLEKDELE